MTASGTRDFKKALLSAPAFAAGASSIDEDLSVAGFDGIRVDGMGEYVLTTMVQPAAEKGRAAGEQVARLLRGEDAPSLHLSSSLREGATTAPPRQR